MSKTFLPPSTIGILGGGQLGRMMAISAREMGYCVVTLDPTENCPCAQVSDHQVVAGYNSLAGAQELVRRSDVITYEFENIGANIAQYIQKHGCLPQGYKLLYTTQNRLREKQAIEAAGATVAPYRPVTTHDDLKQAALELGLPLVLKTCQGGYDGKGQWILRDEAALNNLAGVFKEQAQDMVAEKFLAYEKELSVIVARNSKGDTETFPAAENIHLDNILHLSIAPARIHQEVVRQADEIGRRLAIKLDLIGTLAIELFLLEDGNLVVNELAPRPHNSGHYTQQACSTSQFEQHIRAVCNLPLDNPRIIRPTVMVNILGKHLKQVAEKIPHLGANCKVHLYGKAEAVPNRKMGHINVVADSVEEALEIIDGLNIWPKL